MSEITTAADSVRRHIKSFQSVVAVLDRLGQLDNAEHEATAQLEKIRALENEARKSLEGVQGLIDAARSQAADIVHAGEVTAVKLMNDASALRDSAETAKASADSELAATIAKRDAATTELAALQTKINAARAEVARLLGTR
jgi:chromosome segregation ATPase